MASWIILIFITLILSFFFSGMEIAFVSSNKLKIELDRKNGKISGHIMSYFNKHTSDFVSTILLGNNISLVLYGMAAAFLLESPLKRLLNDGFESDFLIMVIQTIISTLLILLIAEFLPKTLFRLNPNRILHFLSVPLYIIYIFLYPLQFIFVKLSEIIVKYIFRLKFKNPGYNFSLVDLDMFLREYTPANTEGYKHAHEIQMIQNTMDFRNLKVRECMIPRNEIVALEINDDLDTLREAYIKNGHSKILIYKETIDNIVGYTHSYDMFHNPIDIKSITKNILIVPETMPARELLRMFIQSRKHAAVVMDEFGGTSGMLTLEDLLEEIVGEINDEFDQEDLIEKKISDIEYIFSGRLEINYLNDKYHFKLPEDESYSTLAGLIIHKHENIPPVNECIVADPFKFIILQASETRIEQVMLKISGI